VVGNYVMVVGVQPPLDAIRSGHWYHGNHDGCITRGSYRRSYPDHMGEPLMNKFVSFEMIFDNGERFMGNMIVSCEDIVSQEIVENIEFYIRQKLNEDENSVAAVTLVNWKAI